MLKMKKVYDIKIKDLENILALLKENIHDSTVMMDAIRLEDYIKRIKSGFKGTDCISLFEQIQDDVEFHEFYKPFYPIVERFIFTGKTVDELDTEVRYRSILLSDEQVMSDVVEFYGHQGELFYSQVLEFYNESEDHLKFVKDNVDTDGETLFLKSIGEAFVFCPNYSNITKFTILVHEIQHVIDFYINPDFTEEYVIRETIAMFMEMIAADYIAKKYKLFGEGFKRQQYLHSIVKYQSHNVLYKTDALDIASDNRLLGQNELIALLNKEGFDKEDLNFYFDQGITTDMAYQIAYLIAIELYTIFYQDKDLAISICEDIIMNGNSNNIFELLEGYGIKLNSNVVEYENKIYKKRF
jgi:hypothetical protein